jgi:hypothetical protein
MTSHLGQLYVTSGNKLWKRGALGPGTGNAWSESGDALNVTAMTSHLGQLYVTSDNKLWKRGALGPGTGNAWSESGDAYGVTAMASYLGQLYVTSGNKLWKRGALGPGTGNAWSESGDAYLVTAMASHLDQLYVMSNNKLRNPICPAGTFAFAGTFDCQPCPQDTWSTPGSIICSSTDSTPDCPRDRIYSGESIRATTEDVSILCRTAKGLPPYHGQHVSVKYKMSLYNEGRLMLDVWTVQKGEYWRSNNGVMFGTDSSFKVQDDGNLVLVGNTDNRVIWQSGTSGVGKVCLVLHSDRNLVLYKAPENCYYLGDAVWSTNTYLRDHANSPWALGLLRTRDGAPSCDLDNHPPTGLSKPVDGQPNAYWLLTVCGPALSGSDQGGVYLLKTFSDGRDNQVIWKIGGILSYMGLDGASLAVQSDGNMVNYVEDMFGSHDVWASNTAGIGAVTLIVHGSGHVGLYRRSDWTRFWVKFP